MNLPLGQSSEFHRILIVIIGTLTDNLRFAADDSEGRIDPALLAMSILPTQTLSPTYVASSSIVSARSRHHTHQSEPVDSAGHKHFTNHRHHHAEQGSSAEHSYLADPHLKHVS